MDIFGNKNLSDNPCIGVCSTTYGDSVCKGCGRTTKQIKEWNSYSKEHKITINTNLIHKGI